MKKRRHLIPVRIVFSFYYFFLLENPKSPVCNNEACIFISKNHSKAYTNILSKHAFKFNQKPFHFTDQYGVPTKELAGEAMEAEPKSASLTCPGSVSRTLPAFTSLQRENKSEGQTVLMKRLTKLKHWKNQWLACGSCCGSEGRPVPAEHRV